LIVVSTTRIERNSFIDVSILTTSVTRSIKTHPAECSSYHSLNAITESNLIRSVLKGRIARIAFVRASIRGGSRICGCTNVRWTTTRKHVSIRYVVAVLNVSNCITSGTTNTSEGKSRCEEHR
jgi:hypothetical protein